MVYEPTTVKAISEVGLVKAEGALTLLRLAVALLPQEWVMRQ